MRVLVFSDIHGNAVAFDAMLADVQGTAIDHMVCLGDVAQGGPQPAECLDRLASLRCPVVLGNTDQFLLNLDFIGQSAEPVTERQLEVRKWSLAQLQERHLGFIRSFQPTVALPLDENGELLCFHGSPSSFDDVLLPDTSEEEFERMIGNHWAPCMTGGHVHLQWLRRHGRSLFFNPGSVGLSYDHSVEGEEFRFDPWAEYLLLRVEGGRVGVEFRRVPFDPAEVIRTIEESEMPNARESIALWRTG